MSAQPVDVLAVLDETIRKLDLSTPTVLDRPGQSTEHPVHFASRLHELRMARAAVAELIAAVADVYVETDVVCAVSCPCRIRAALARCGGQP